MCTIYTFILAQNQMLGLLSFATEGISFSDVAWFTLFVLLIFELISLAGSSKVTEFLLSRGIPVDIDYGRGTALYHAAINEQDKTVKILLDHHANVSLFSFPELIWIDIAIAFSWSNT